MRALDFRIPNDIMKIDIGKIDAKEDVEAAVTYECLLNVTTSISSARFRKGTCTHLKAELDSAKASLLNSPEASRQAESTRQRERERETEREYRRGRERRVRQDSRGRSFDPFASRDDEYESRHVARNGGVETNRDAQTMKRKRKRERERGGRKGSGCRIFFSVETNALRARKFQSPSASTYVRTYVRIRWTFPIRADGRFMAARGCRRI